MATSVQQGVEGGSVRLWIDPPFTDETISGVLDRGAAGYAMDRAALIQHLLPDFRLYGHTPDWDRPRDDHRQAFAEALGLETGQRPGAAIRPYADLVAPLGRSAYCPLCFMENLSACRTPHFRWQWTPIYVTMCHVHRTPLFDWRKMRRYQRVLPRRWVIAASSELANDCTWLDEDVARAESAREAVGRPGTPLNQVMQFQDRFVDLSVGPAGHWEKERAKAWQVQDAIEKVTARESRDAEPLASRDAPHDQPPFLFGKLPKDDWPRLPRNSMKGFSRQRSVSWRRSIIHAAARLLQCPKI